VSCSFTRSPSDRPNTAIRYPCSANFRAVSYPMPREAPLMIATFSIFYANFFHSFDCHHAPQCVALLHLHGTPQQEYQAGIGGVYRSRLPTIGIYDPSEALTRRYPIAD